jgi:hypothetical protein
VSKDVIGDPPKKIVDITLKLEIIWFILLLITIKLNVVNMLELVYDSISMYD